MRKSPFGSKMTIPARLLVFQMIAFVVGTVAAAVVADGLGRKFFLDHLMEPGHGTNHPEALEHIERAYTSATCLSLTTALVVALLVAFIFSLLAAERIRQVMGPLVAATTAVAEGRSRIELQPPGIGDEVDGLTRSFNQMSERLESVEQNRLKVLADVAHEMRTPISTILLHCDALDDQVVPWSAELSTTLHSQLARLTRLANDIDELTRAEEGQLDLHRRRVSIRALVDSAVQAAEHQFDVADVRLVVDAGGRDAMVLADPDRMGQVLANVLTNAVGHSPAGSTVRLELAGGDDVVDVRIKDQGEGIDPHDLEHVFERFFRARRGDQNRPGSGIGLTISRAIVHAHGGSMTAHSAGLGRGATIVVTLPISDHDENFVESS